ncbi:MAG: cytoplasmic protein, partial [Chloroflexi bacterium]|nr:cytoplasmic protein [Chloroflexota bacterium]
MGKTILIAGYGQTVVYTEFQGAIQSSFSRNVTAARHVVAILREHGCTVTYMPANVAADEFPENIASLSTYDALLLGDISADTLLLKPDAVFASTASANRLDLIREYASHGGGFMMTGGWFSFQGISGKGRYHETPVEEILPVSIRPYDDRVETPEGAAPQVRMPEHPILKDLPREWPPFLGYNRLSAKNDSDTIMTIRGDPFLVTGWYGKGKVAAFASSLAPHWG